MFAALPQTVQDEIVELAERYGQPLTQLVNLHTNTYFDPLNKTDRYGEVCMVVRRPNGRLLTMIKTFYPKGAYRLLTGGIDHGESIFHALLRETQEETGLEVAVQRFLAAAAYRSADSETPIFYSFAFLLDEVGGTLGQVDEHERIEGFREIEPRELLDQARFLEQLSTDESPELRAKWSDWGRFRAIMHYMVGEALDDRTKR